MSKHHHRILLAEKNAQMLKDLKRVLEAANYGVIDVASSDEELLYKASQLSPDVVLVNPDLFECHEKMDAAKIAMQKLSIPVVYLGQDAGSHPMLKESLVNPCSQTDVITNTKIALYKAYAQKKIRVNEIQFSKVLNVLNNPVVAVDADCRLVYMNAAAESMTGYVTQRVLSQKLEEFMVLKERRTGERIMGLEQLFFEGSHPMLGMQPFRCVSTYGAQCLVDFHNVELASDNSKEIARVLVFNDVTEVYEGRVAQRLLLSALNVSSDALGVVHAESMQWVYVNGAFTKLFRSSPERLLKKSVKASLLWGEVMAGQLEEALRTRQNISNRVSFRVRTDEVYECFVSVSLVLDVSGLNVEYLTVSVVDASKEYRMEQCMRQAQKIESVGSFTGGIAHDFNNILSVINSYADLMLLKVGKESDLERYVSHIRAAGAKGSNLVAQLMSFSRHEMEMKQKLNIVEVLQSIYAMLERVFEESIHLMIHVPSDPIYVYADKGQVEQMIMNLCVNARDAMSNGGQLTLSAQLKDNCVQIVVQDTGMGITQEIQKQMFKPFFTTKPVGKGTGLGLATVHAIVHELGGSIQVNSVLGKGTRFEIQLPQLSSEKNDSTHAETYVASAVSEKRILILDTDLDFVECLSGLLHIHGYTAQAWTQGVLPEDWELSLPVDLVIANAAYRGVRGVFEKAMQRNASVKTIVIQPALSDCSTLQSDYTLSHPAALKDVLELVNNALVATTR